MKKISVIFTLLALFITACSAGKKPLQISDPSQSIEASAGSDFTIVLSSNPTTGYHWELIGEPDANIVQYASKEYKASEPAAVGSGGVDVWTFHALATGTAQITLGYYPPSNDPVEPQQSITFNVIVK